MNEKSLRVLEFNKIIDKLKTKASSSLGLKHIENLKPSNDFDEVKNTLLETSEAQAILIKRGLVSMDGIHDIEDKAKRAHVGATLDPRSLLKIADCLRVARSLKRNLEGSEEEDLNYPIIQALTNSLYTYRDIEDRIYTSIVGESEISDNASTTLRTIRRRIVQKNQSIRSKLNSIISSTTYQKYLQDNIISMRGDRFVIPVKAEYRSVVSGIVHDQSSSGATLFIEPMSIVEMNNELRKLKLDEQEEIERILAELSAMIGEISSELISNQEILGKLDFAFAKGKLSVEMRAIEPVLNEEKYFYIKNGRHPMIDKRDVVPNTVYLGKDFDTLVITGPNTGGKTVTIKTVGLFALMTQSGLHIPADFGTSMCVYYNIFADIGDEQSIEQSLSTFSSHMTNIVKILDKADDRSLCLFDELCSGTDPTEGAALAISILNTLHNYGSVTMATTHYSELKIYALSTDGVENASCEFNVETLSPTYRLLIGIPGKSNAFAISSKLGLSDTIIEDARKRINAKDLDFEDLIANLEAQRQTIEKEQLEINRYKTQTAQLKKQLEDKNKRIDQNKDKIIREANEEAYNILKEAKELADKTIRNFNKYGQGQAPMSQMEKERSALRDKMSAKEKRLSDIKKDQTKKNHKAPKKLRIGDSVLVLSLNLKGTVHTLPNAKGDLYVQMGILRSLVNINDLVLINDDISPAKKFGGIGSKIKMSKSLSVSSEINLIGKTTDEAIALLDKYLDDAYIAHLSSVRIVHGKGTGALRAAVHNHLKRMKTIKEYHLGEFGEGDAGVTIATFK